jgi:DNA-directed RNA polymerase alpha subunit
MLLDLLPLPVMALAGLRRKRIRNLADLATLSEDELKNINGVGRQSLAIIQSEMKRHGIAFRPSDPFPTEKTKDHFQ